jgi:hypothetical protein
MTVGRRAIASVGRLNSLVDQHDSLKTDATALLDAALICGEFERGAAAGLTALPERTAQRVLNDTMAAGLLGSSTPKGPVSLRFPDDALEVLCPPPVSPDVARAKAELRSTPGPLSPKSARDSAGSGHRILCRV